MPKPPKSTALYFTSVVTFGKEAVLGGHLYSEAQTPTVTRFMLCSGEKWGHLTDLPDVAYAMTRKPGEGRTIAIMGRNGRYREITGNNPPIDLQLPDIQGLYLLDLSVIGDALYACGVQNRVIKQVGSRWIDVDQGTFLPFKGKVESRLESIHGFSASDIYAVGSGGAIWHKSEDTWVQLKSPTKMDLNVALCASDGFVYVGGAKGIILRGKHNEEWVQLGDPEEKLDAVEDITEFRESIYVAATSKLLKITRDQVEDVQPPVQGERSFYALDSNDECLWSVGGDLVLSYDGSTWQQFSCPEN